MNFRVQDLGVMKKGNIDKFIVTKYYDGPLVGYCLDNENLDCYFFALVAWTKRFDTRLYALAEFAEKEFVALEDQLRRLGYQPLYPIWVMEWMEDPKIRSRCDSILDDARNKIENFSRYMLSSDLTRHASISNIPTDKLEVIHDMAVNEDYQTLEL